jgi:hypothetical protein
MQDDGHGMPLCSGASANEYLGWNLTAIVRSVQNGDNSPSTAPGIEYLGTLPPTLLGRADEVVE